jgi:hypothetical protein
MKLDYHNIAGLVLLIALGTSASYAQQQFTHTVTAANRNCNTVCSVLDIPELNNNPAAVIFVTPVGNARDLNPHPIGAYYMYLKKWSIFNLDGVGISEGAKYKVEYFANSGPDRFVYTVPRQVHLSDIPYIDREGLNGNPNAQVRLFPTSSPTHGALYNRDDVKAEYDSKVGKWYVANVNGKPVPWEAVYNVSVSPGGIASNASPGPGNPGRDGKIPGQIPAPPNAVPASQAGTPSVTKIVPPALTNPPGLKGPLPLATPRWTLREELPPSIAPNSEILLFIHGMDSRAEEAGDITKELFALRASGYQPQPEPQPTQVTSPSLNAAMIPVLQQLLQRYKGCILERYETQQDLINRGLNGNLSGLSNTNGLQVRDNVKCVAGNNCSLAFRATQFSLMQAQANRGDATNFQSKLENIIPADCFLCAKHQEMHTKHVHCTMEAGGNSGLQGPVFEGCKAGVDIEKLANDVINDIDGFIRDITGIKLAETEMIGGPSVATNFSTVHFTSCPNPAGGCPEGCDFPDDRSGGQRTAVVPYEKTADGQQVRVYYEPLIPPSLLDPPPPPSWQINQPAAHNIGKNEGRLRPELRTAAADAHPLKSLRLATYQFAAGNIETGTAFADLSVTGRRAFGEFSKALPQESFCQSLIAQRPSQFNESEVLKGCYKALDRAYAVANFLRTGERGDTPAEKLRKTKERNELGYIAVSGEDDLPHRPVNVPSSDYPQYDIDVIVETPMSAGPQKSVTVRARYVIAQSGTSANNAKNLVVISMDLPTSGYTQTLDYDLISPLSAIGHPKTTPLPLPLAVPSEIVYAIPGMPAVIPPGVIIPIGIPFPDFQSTGETPLLDFIETFVVRFTETLNQKVPIENNIKAVMGGSLGGNMTFRLGRRPGVEWLPKFIVWSPASIWNSLGEGNDLLKHLGPRKAWENANKASTSTGAGDRADFFGAWDGATAWPIIREAQSGTWTSEYYPCKLSAVAGARFDRHETYDARFLAWHWRLGAEQLLFSHQTTDPATHQPRFMSNQKPMLLACGLEDQVPYNEICPATQKTAKLMTLTPGKALFLDKTGHSVDNERRMFFAQQILDFLK